MSAKRVTCPDCHLSFERTRMHTESECQLVRLSVQTLIDKGVTPEIYRQWHEARSQA